MQSFRSNSTQNLSYSNVSILAYYNSASDLMFIFWAVVIPVIASIGLLGNILTIYVLFRREIRSTFIYYLQALTITDTIIIVGAILCFSVIAVTQQNPEMWLFNDVVYPCMFTPMNYLLMTSQMINVWVMVGISAERYIAVCRPLKVHTKKDVLTFLAVIIIVSLMYNIPRCFATKVIECKAGMHTCYTIVSTDFGASVFYTEYYVAWMYTAVIYIAPLLAIGELNTLIIVRLFRLRKSRPPSNMQEHNESNITIVLLVITAVFIFCQTPGLCAQLTVWDPETLLKLVCVSNTLYVLNSSVNVFIYIIVGRKFRKVLWEALMCRRKCVNCPQRPVPQQSRDLPLSTYI